MDKLIWRQKYSTIQPLPCPRCTGKVKLDKDSLIEREAGYSIRAQYQENWTHYDIESRFVCVMVCDSRWCGEVVAVSGIVSHEEEPVYGDTELQSDFFKYYYPKSMVPPPKPFKLSKKLSRECQGDLSNAFKLLWNDPSSCANRLRVFVEHLLDQLKVPRSIPKKPRNLNSRIERFGEDHPEHMRLLHALRHVGNAGSHSAKASFSDVVECFVLVEAIVKALIDREMDEVHKTAEKLTAKFSPKPDRKE